jgi:catechol 2,3-dioxygenase-like lactoylglutathione lyase family enzyme
MLDTIQAIAIGDRNAILRTNDAGVTWTNQTIAISAIYSWKNISFFDSPVLTLSSVDSVRNPKVKKELVKNKLGVGVRFHFGMTGERRLDEYFIKLKRKGIIVVSEPKTEFWGDRIFTVEDPDGYTLTFSEHVQDVSPEARVNAYELAHQEKIRV